LRLHKYIFLPNIKSLSVFAQKLWSMLQLYGQNSIFDLWPWRMTLTLYFYHSKCATLWDAPVNQISNVYLYWVKCYGKRKSGLFYLYICSLTLKDDLDLDKLPLKMCSLSRCICMPKYQVSICNGSKYMANVKVVLKQTNKQTDKQTGRQTNRQGKNNMPPRSYLGGIKNKAWCHSNYTCRSSE